MVRSDGGPPVRHHDSGLAARHPFQFQKVLRCFLSKEIITDRTGVLDALARLHVPPDTEMQHVWPCHRLGAYIDPVRHAAAVSESGGLRAAYALLEAFAYPPGAFCNPCDDLLQAEKPELVIWH